ncbi:MAG TPA: hypothetical protein VFS00_13225, partial [Polyangiaceae bacterium]|nr:hypothetical protein [Polyangiaceae bacterium]
ARRQARRRLARRAALGALALATAGAAAGLTVKMVRRAHPDAAPIASASVDPAPASAAPPPPSAVASAAPPDPVASAAPPPRSAPASAPSPPRPAVEAPTSRLVALTVDPQSALVSIDQKAPVEAFTLMVEGPRLMTVGNHTISITPKDGSRCCEPMPPTTLDVPAPLEPGEVISRPFRLLRRPATLVSEGPSTAQIFCAGTPVKGSAAASYTIKMHKNDERVDCSLLQDGAEIGKRKVTVKAGESTTVSWGAPR